MALRDQILKLARQSPVEVRNAFYDVAVLEALSDIGVFPKVLEMHAPSPRSRKMDGLGPTLCGRNGTRHAVITCKQCLEKLN
jgi:hypothetical protein